MRAQLKTHMHTHTVEKRRKGGEEERWWSEKELTINFFRSTCTSVNFKGASFPFIYFPILSRPSRKSSVTPIFQNGEWVSLNLLRRGNTHTISRPKCQVGQPHTTNTEGQGGRRSPLALTGPSKSLPSAAAVGQEASVAEHLPHTVTPHIS